MLFTDAELLNLEVKLIKYFLYEEAERGKRRHMFYFERGTTPYCNRIWSMDKTIWTLAIWREPTPGARDTSNVQIVLSNDKTRLGKGLLLLSTAVPLAFEHYRDSIFLLFQMWLRHAVNASWGRPASNQPCSDPPRPPATSWPACALW